MNRLLEQLQFLQHPRVQAVAQYTGYILFFLLVLLLAVPATFPTRQLASFLSRQAAAKGYPLEIGELSLVGLGGVEIDGLRLTLPGKDPVVVEGGAGQPGIPETELKIDKLTARVALFPALFGQTIDVTFEMQAGGGTLEGGRIVRKGEVMDIDVEKITEISLAEMGLGPRALAGQKLTGDLHGDLSGAVQVHWGGSTEDLHGSVDLELADAVLRSPELHMEGGLRLTDLAMGAVTLRVKMNLKQNLAALAAQRGSDKATVLHIEQMEAVGDQLELVTEETSHILIPPGKQGFKAATLQLHFAFSLPEKKAGDKGKEQPDRLKWSQMLTMAGSKLKPFERNGFIGITCTGPLARPQCRPALPQVTVGTRKGGEGTARPVEPGKPGQEAPPTPEGATEPDAAPREPMEFRPAVRPEAQQMPEPRQEEPPPEPPMPPPEQPQPTPTPEEAPRVEPGAADQPPEQQPQAQPEEDRGETPPTEPPPGTGEMDEEMPEGPRGRQDPDEAPVEEGGEEVPE